jgi:large repetitive protein
MKISSKLISTILFAIFTLSLNAQTTFRFSYDFGSFDITGGMVQTPAREFVVAGLNNSAGPYYGDAMKIDTAGNVLWAKSYTAGFATNFSDIKNVSTGGYIITGSSTSGGGGALLLRIDAAGAVLWAFRYQLPDKAGKPSNESGNAVIETSDGGFLVGGSVDYFWDGASATTVDTTMPMGFKVNSSGVLQWSKVWTITVANPDEHYINDVAESADGYFFAGQTSEGTGTLSSNGDYPSNTLLIKTTTAGALTYIRKWGASGSSQSINSALLLSTGNILLGGADDVNAFLVSVSGTGTVTPTVIFNKRLNGSAFGSNYLIQDIMENSDGNYSIIGTQITVFPTFAFNTLLGKINSTSGAWMFGRTYAPIGLSAILPEGGLCTDQGFYVCMTDQQAGGFNFNIIRTNASGQTNDPASGCPGTAITPALGAESVTFGTPVSSNFDLMTSSSFAPVIANATPTRIQHCLNAPSGLSVTPSSQNVSCNGACNGTASVTASGGTGPYTYTWSPSGGNASSATSLCPNTYTCTIKDNVGTTTTQTFTITQPASALSSSPSQGTILCNGGTTSATVSASGGTAGYTYTWAPSGGSAATATGLAAGNYTATITDTKSCTTTNTFTITQPSAVTATAASSAANCGGSNGTATVTPSGGTAGYTYSWSPSGGSSSTASGLAAGSYSVLVKDGNNCATTTTVAVSSLGGPSVTAVQTISVTCNGGNNGGANLSIAGGTPSYSVSWSGGGSGASISGLTAGTYTAIVTDASSCMTTTVVTVIEPTPIAITFTNNSAAGCSASTGSVTANASGGTGAMTYTWNTGASGQTLSSVPAGSYTVTATDANNCSQQAAVTIATTTGPAVTPVATASVSCNGGSNGTASVSISGGTPTYTVNWSGGASGTTVTGLSVGIYTVTVTDAASCITTETVSIAGPPSITLTVNSTPAGCTNPVGSATASAMGGTGAMTYTWSDTQTGATATGLGNTTYTVVSTDGNGCKDSTTVSIGVTAGPTVTITGFSPSGCISSVGTATANATGGTGIITYTWSNGVSGANDTAMSVGIYTVTATDANGCINTNTVSIGTTNSPTVTATGSPTGCTNAVGTATANISGGTGTITYTWSNAQTGATASGLGNNTYTVVATDANGCKDSTTVSIGVTPGPTVSISGSTPTGCTNSVGTATATVSGGTGTITYNWSNSQTGATASGLGQNTYTVVAVDANGCKDSTTVSIGISGGPTVTVNSTPTGCTNTIGSATASVSGGTGTITYSWSNSQTGNTATGLGHTTYTVVAVDANGCKDSTTVSIGVSANPVVTIDSTHAVKCFGQANGTAYSSVTGGTPGYGMTWSNGASGIAATNLANGSYTIVVTDANGCKDSATATITQPAPLTETISAVQPENCNKANGAATVTAGGGTTNYTYTWSSEQSTSTVTNFPAGTYTVVVTDANGCTISDTAHIGNIAGPTGTVTAQSNATCFGSSNGSATVTAIGGTPTYTYTWSNGATGSSVGGLISGGYVTTITDAAGCTYTVPVFITQPSAITVTVTTVPVSCSGGNNGSATANASGGTLPYVSSVWSNGQTTGIDTNLTAGTFTVVYTDTNSCTGTGTAFITENPPVDTLQITGSLCLNDPAVTLTAPSISSGSQHQWSLSTIVIPGATTYTYSGNSSTYGAYSVMWYYNGCRYITTNVFVTVSQDLGNLPQTNIFTPNDDNINDAFIPFSTSTINAGSTTAINTLLSNTFEDYELSIYDRWGILLFKTNVVTDSWNGKTTDGKDCAAGTYYWISKYKAKCSKNTGEQNIKGFVQLIR